MWSPQPQGWPGVFRPLQHYVQVDARRLRLRGQLFAFAFCGSPCLPSPAQGIRRAWCLTCRRELDRIARAEA